MVMDSIFTPRIYPLSSSVFMTPPDSDEKRQYSVVHSTIQTPRPLPHVSAFFLTPNTPPRRTTKGKALEMDILSKLVESGFLHLVDDILSLLSPSDLISCMRVSHDWKEMVMSRQTIMTKITTYRMLCKSKAENLHKSMNKPFNHQAQPSRQPLSSISANIQSKPPNLPASVVPPIAKTNHHRPCPQCQSPAKELNLRRAECTNTKCKLDFCLNCFENWHEGECPSRSPKRPARSTAIAGTLTCKKRLRRL